jgi:hypothetical protein
MKMVLLELCRDSADRICVAQDTEKLKFLVNLVSNLRNP